MLSHWLNKEWPGENRIPQKSLVILVNHRFPHHKMNVFGCTPFSDTPKDIFKKTMLASAVGIIHDITTMLMAPPQVGTSTLSLYCSMVIYSPVTSHSHLSTDSHGTCWNCFLFQLTLCQRVLRVDSEFSAGDGLILGLPIWVSWSWGIADGRMWKVTRWPWKIYDCRGFYYLIPFPNKALKHSPESLWWM